MACLLMLFFLLCAPLQTQSGGRADMYTNPLLTDGPDPWLTSRGYTYYNRYNMADNLVMRRIKDITDWRHTEKQILWNPDDPPNSKCLWAPEIHGLDRKWYAYNAVITNP